MTTRLRLGELALARSGDKGADANIGVWTENEALYQFFVDYLTAERVEAHFRSLGMREVQRYELPNLNALNFVLVDALDGGGTVSLRTDAQGKTLSLGLLQMMVDVPDWLVPETTKRHAAFTADLRRDGAKLIAEGNTA